MSESLVRVVLSVQGELKFELERGAKRTQIHCQLTLYKSRKGEENWALGGLVDGRKG